MFCRVAGNGERKVFLLLRINCKKKLLPNAQIGTLSPCLKLWSGKSRETSGPKEIGLQCLRSARLGVPLGMDGDICTAA
jgi:hypothetical protein